MNQALPTNALSGNSTADIPLRDIHLPDPVGLWPLAPGWWALLLLVLFISAASVFYIRRKRLASAYRREALNALNQLTESYKSQEATHINNHSQLIVLKKEYLEKSNTLLKRTALTAYPQATRLSVAAFTGEQWTGFLYMHCPALSKHTAITEHELADLLKASYQRAPAEIASVSLNALHDLARYWILHHSTVLASINRQDNESTMTSPAVIGGN